MERVLYFDCLSGISGDMTIGALLDLGIDQQVFRDELAKLELGGCELAIARGTKNGISGTDFTVKLLSESGGGHHHGHYHGQGHGHSHHSDDRNVHAIEALIDKSALSDGVKALSKEIFRKVAVAEAKIHDKAIEDVHFHEVGAIDSIVDIVGTAICLELLDVDTIYASPLHVGTGFVQCAHGRIPVPAPATLEILQGVPIYSTGIRSELVTPTGAAIVKTIAADFVPLPELHVEAVGYGLGKKDLPITNVLRVLMGKKKPSSPW